MLPYFNEYGYCWLTVWLTDWLIDWLTDWLIDWLIDWLTDWLTDWLLWQEELSTAVSTTPQSLHHIHHVLDIPGAQSCLSLSFGYASDLVQLLPQIWQIITLSYYAHHSFIHSFFHSFILSLFRGFLELLVSVACNGNKLGSTPIESLQSLLHLMNSSSGRMKRTKLFRKSSLSLRHFVFS